jgi:nitroreductase
VMDRFRAMFGIPKDVAFHFCIPLGYPAVKYGASRRKPIEKTTSWNRWEGRVPWA